MIKNIYIIQYSIKLTNDKKQTNISVFAADGVSPFSVNCKPKYSFSINSKCWNTASNNTWPLARFYIINFIKYKFNKYIR
jgi:hypothetical protein